MVSKYKKSEKSLTKQRVLNCNIRLKLIWLTINHQNYGNLHSKQMKSYIKYIKRQNHNVQDIHATIFATIATIIVASIYLQLKYHIFYPEYTEVIYIKEKPDLTPSPSPKERGEIRKNFLKEIMEQKSVNKTPNTIDLFMDIIDKTKANFIDKI